MFVPVLLAAALLQQPPRSPQPPAPRSPADATPLRPAAGEYRPPVPGEVVAPFDESNGRFGPGNRGLDYAVGPGDPVAAIGGGTVVFAGSVAGSLWVTVLHPDGLRSSVGPLASVEVARGRRVGVGERLGTAGATLHLGVRSGARYIDPAPLFGRRNARLVPVPAGRRR